MSRTKVYLLTFLFLWSLLLRVYKLDRRPLGFTWDEAAVGYNAFSLIHTGRDEHGIVLPVIFKSFSDYKPGLYIYLSVPAISIIGLNEFSTRLPSAVIGALTSVMVIILTRRFLSFQTAYIAGVFTSINPWSLHFSRGAWEANVALFLSIVAITLFIKKRIILSSLFFGLSLITYQGSKLSVPFFVVLLMLLFRPRVSIKSLGKAAILLFCFFVVILAGASSQFGRLKVFSVFSYTRSENSILQILKSDNTVSKNMVYYLFHSERLNHFRGIMQRYLNHISPQFLFFSGDWSNPRHSTTYHGYFFITEIATLLIGSMTLLRFKSKATIFIFIWALFSPIPSALSRDIVSGVRSLPLSIPLIILSAIGFSTFGKKVKYAFAIVTAFLLINYLDLYYLHYPQFSSEDWLFAYPPAIKTMLSSYSEHSQIIISDKLGQPYIFVLFHMKYPPKKYQNSAKVELSNNHDVSRVLSFDKFIFRPIYYPQDRNLERTLLVGDQFELPESDLENSTNVETIWRSTLANGKPGFSVVTLK